MTINFIPKYVIANEGCFYWGWYPACEIQIFLVLPLIVYFICRVKSPLIQAILIFLGLIIGMMINAFIIS